MTEPEHLTFGVFLKAFRSAHDEMTQQQLADAIGCSRSLIGMLEIERQGPSRPFLGAFIDTFPDEAATIQGVLDHLVTRPLPKRDSDHDQVLRAIDSYLARGSVVEAESILVPHLREVVSSHTWDTLSTEQLHVALELFSRAQDTYAASGDSNAQLNALRNAANCAMLLGLQDQATALWHRGYALMMGRGTDFDVMRKWLANDLRRNLGEPALWYYKGLVEWWQSNTGKMNAYACLTAAVNLSRVSLPYRLARGMLLTDLYEVAPAVEDLERCLSLPSLSPIEDAYARSAYALTLNRMGEIDRAEAELRRAETLAPDNPWVRYFRMHFLDSTARTREVVRDAEYVVASNDPFFGDAQRTTAQAKLAQRTASIYPIAKRRLI